APAIGDTDGRFCGSFRLFRTDRTPVPYAETPMAQVLNGAAPIRNQEVVIERRDASRIILRINIDPLYDIKGRLSGGISVFEDVTDLKQAEQASQRLASIVASSGDAIVRIHINRAF